MKARFLLFLVCGFWVLFVAQAGFGAQSPWVSDDHMKARLIAADADDGTLALAVQVQMEPGWHSYWRSPGEAGLPYRFDWSGSENLSGFNVRWPLPSVFDEGGLVTYGYSGSVIFPVEAVRMEPKDPSHVALHLNAMACHELCVPQSFALKMDLNAGEIGVSNGFLIDFGLQSVPERRELDHFRINLVQNSEKKVVVELFQQENNGNSKVFVEFPQSGLVYVADAGEVLGDQEGVTRYVFDIMDDITEKTMIVTAISDQESIEKVLEF